MSAPTVNVTVKLYAQDGTPYADTLVRAKLDKNDVYDGFIISEEVTGTTDEDGEVVLALFPNNPVSGLGTTGSVYTVKANPSGGKSWRVTAQIPNTDCNLEDVADTDIEAGESAAQAAQSAAQASAIAAEASEVAAAASAVAAASSASTSTTQAGISTAQAVISTAQAVIATTKADEASDSADTAVASIPHQGATPPVDPIANREWINTTTGKRYAYYNDGTSVQWVEAGSVAFADDPATVAAAVSAKEDAEDAEVSAAADAAAALAARVGAESAAAAAIIGAGVYVDEPTGRAAVANGVAFKVQGSGDIAAYEYRRVDGSSSTLIGTYPSDTAVTQPKWAGHKNGYPDPFFRDEDHLVSTTVLGEVRWWSGFTSWAVAANTYFDGQMLQKTGNVNLSGPMILLSDLGLVEGDTLTVNALFTGAGAVAILYGRFALPNGDWVGIQQQGLSDTGASSITTSSTPQRHSMEVVVPATATHLRLYPATNAGLGTFNIVSLWAFKGAKASGPSWPSLADPDGLKAIVDGHTETIEDHEDRITEIESSSGVTWAGRKNGWLDPFFRETEYLESTTILDATRWWGGFTSWTIDDNSQFDGQMLQKTGSGNLSGPIIRLSDLDAVEGDTITMCMLVKGAGATAISACRCSTDGGTFLGTQANGLSDSGDAFVVTSSTPQRLVAEIVVPATATQLRVYPVTNGGGGTFDIVALWAFKGERENGPDWPSLGDPDALNHKVETNTDDLEALDARLDDVEPLIEYAVQSYGSVTADATSIELNGTSFSSFARDLVFMGHGERYTPAGVSFNAVRIKEIARTAASVNEWRTLNVVVRTGASSHLAAAPVVAVGSATVVSSSDTLTDVDILLLDPDTGEVITLTDSDFSGGEYFIGVYALDSVGDPAGCGEFWGTFANTVGQSYYHTSVANAPLTGAWSTNTGNPRQGVQHLLLTNPVQGTSYEPSAQLVSDIAEQTAAPEPEVVVPPYIFGVQSRECNVYTDNLFLADANEYLPNFAASYGAQQNERWTWTPAAALASGTLVFTAHDKCSGDELATGTAQLRAAASSAGSGLTKNVIVIGDSLINAGTITQTMLDIVTLGDVMALNLIGTRGTGANKHEGRGGWTVNAYTTNYSDVPSGSNPFWISGAVNFPQYLVNNALTTPDWVFIALGINDCFGLTTDASVESLTETAFASLDTLIASIKDAGAGVKVALVLPSPPSYYQDSFGANYETGQTRWRFKRNIVIWARELIATYSGLEASRIYLVPSNTALDTVNNMSVAAATAVNSRNTATVIRQSNGVHPGTDGYEQIGDAWWAFLKYYATA
jgi:lysophospholipase L1-like esterase